MTVNIFDADYYRLVNPDLQQFTDEQASQHWQNFGQDENRRFSPIVDLDFYRANNPDLAAAGLTTNREIVAHIEEYGIREGRNFSEGLDLAFYQANNNDLANLTFEQLFEHYRTFGVNEGRLAAPINVSNNVSNDVTNDLQPNVVEATSISSTSTSTSVIEPSFLPPQFPNNGNTSPPGDLPIAPDTELPSFDPVGDDTGDILNSSIDMAVRDFNITLNESVGSSDPNDYYRFVVENNSQFNLSVSGSFIGVEMYLDGNNDSQLETDELFISGASGLSGSPNDFNGARTSFSGNLTDGNYYVRIFTSLDESDYQLTVSTFNNVPSPVF